MKRAVLVGAGTARLRRVLRRGIKDHRIIEAKLGLPVIVTIPQKEIPSLPHYLLAGLGDSVVVVDTGNYYPQARDGAIPGLDTGLLDSQWVAVQLGRPVIKAFNNIGAASLRDKVECRLVAGDISAADMPQRIIAALAGAPIGVLAHAAGVSPSMETPAA